MGPIEYALFAQACRLDGHVLTSSPPVRAELDCLAQAISDTCRTHGMTDAITAEFLRMAATRVHVLEPEIKGRLALRRTEQQILQALGRAIGGAGPESQM